MIEKVVLVNTNPMKPLIAPIGIDYTAESMALSGFDVDILDLALEENPALAVEKYFSRSAPMLIGAAVRNIDDCYMASGQSFISEIKAIIDKIKSVSDAPVVLGGVGYSVSPISALEIIDADFGIRGDAESALPELARRLISGADFSNIPGLLFRRDNKIIENPPKFFDLFSIAARTRKFIDNAKYFKLGGQGSIETKRGCPGACVYCADPVAKGRSIRLANPQNVAAEIEALYAQGVDVLHTCDCEFNIPVEHSIEVCKAMISRRLGDKVKWYAYLSPSPFSAELAEPMRRAGCVGINFGSDSLHPEILKRLGRNFAPVDIAFAVSECRKRNIKTMIDLLLGGPGETPATVRHTIDAVKKIDPDRVGISLGIRVFPETAMAQWVLDKKIELSRPRQYLSGDLLFPAFYISPELGPDPESMVAEIVGNDSRFFFADTKKADRNYNYSDNTVLVEAIAKGYRGAYWDILRRLAE